MSNTSLEAKIAKALQELHPEIQTVLHVENYIGNVHAFFAQFPSQALLESEWERLSNTIAIYYQSRLDSEFEIWNIYLFYVVTNDVERHIKYKIENDTISSRKIVLAHNGEIDSDFMNSAVEEHITNTNLRLLPTEKSPANMRGDFAKNKTIWEEISRSGMLSDKKGDATVNALELIEKKLKQNEI